MISRYISTKVVKISVLFLCLILLGTMAIPAFSISNDKVSPPFVDTRIFKRVEIDQGPESFIVTVSGLGVEEFQGRVFSLAEINVYNRQAFQSGHAFAVLSGRQMQTVFQSAFDMGLDLRLYGYPVEAPEGTIYETAKVYMISSATSW